MQDLTFDFSGKAFLVTGASSGIGQETVRELLRSGAAVLGLARHMESVVEQDFPERLTVVNADVMDSEAVEAAVSSFVGKQGRLSGMVHAAGMTQLVPLRAWHAEAAKHLMDVNFWAGVSLLKLVSQKRYAVEGASHVFLSSVSAHHGQAGMLDYSASKGAVEAMVRSAAQELARRKQRVNSVCFGWIEGTRMTSDTDNIVGESLLGNGRPEDAAGIIQFLLSDASRWITGSNLIADGGYLS